MLISCNILKKHIKNSDTIDFVSVWDKFTIRTAEVEGVYKACDKYKKADGDAVYLEGVVSRKKQMIPSIMGVMQ